jgi:hypothetical protein
MFNRIRRMSLVPKRDEKGSRSTSESPFLPMAEARGFPEMFC